MIYSFGHFVGPIINKPINEICIENNCQCISPCCLWLFLNLIIVYSYAKVCFILYKNTEHVRYVDQLHETLLVQTRLNWLSSAMNQMVLHHHEPLHLVRPWLHQRLATSGKAIGFSTSCWLLWFSLLSSPGYSTLTCHHDHEKWRLLRKRNDQWRNCL